MCARFRGFPALVSLLLAAVCGAVSGCSSNSAGSPRALAPVSSPARPAPSPSSPPPARPSDPRAAEAEVVRQYFRVINHLDTDMNAAALADLMTASCPCRVQVRSIRKQAALGRHFVGSDRINALRPNLDGHDAGDVVVDVDATAGGIVSSSGQPLTSSAAADHINRDFVMREVQGRWLIARIDVL